MVIRKSPYLTDPELGAYYTYHYRRSYLPWINIVRPCSIKHIERPHLIPDIDVKMGRRRIQRCNTAELKDMIVGNKRGKWYRPSNPYDEVFPGILLGDAETALSTILLKELGVTHVLNAAQGTNTHLYGGFVSTHPSYYSRKGIKYIGIPAMDMPGFYLKPYFRQAADFIQEALGQGGKVLVHCQCGVSRSASLVMGFLMLKRGMNVQTALNTIKKKRSIFPNHGFLSQLADFDYELRRSGAVEEEPELRLVDYERDYSSEAKKSYPRFRLLNSKPMTTYSDSKNYVQPRRAVSCERYESPVRTFADNPLVDTERQSRARHRSASPVSVRASSPVRAVSPVRYTRSSTLPIGLDDDLYDPRIFDTYKRYSRRGTSPIPVTNTTYITRESRPIDPYWSPRTIEYDYLKAPRKIHYDTYVSPASTYQYMRNLDRYYDTYKYYRHHSPFFGEGVTQTPYVEWYSTPYKQYLTGYANFPSYPYTEVFKPLAKYPTTSRTLNTYTTTLPLRDFTKH